MEDPRPCRFPDGRESSRVATDSLGGSTVVFLLLSSGPGLDLNLNLNKILLQRDFN